MRDLTPEAARYYGLKSTNGVLIVTVAGESCAERAGLLAEDVITDIDDDPVTTMEQVRKKISITSAGGTLVFGVWRSRARLTVNVSCEWLGN